MCGEAADDLHRRRQNPDLENASVDRTDIAAMTGPNEVTEYRVRFGCDRLDEWRFDACSLKCQNETTELALQNTFDLARRVKSIPRNTPRYSHDSLGHCESSIKEVEKPIRVMIFHTVRADHERDCDRRASWTIAQCTVKAEEQTSFFKLICKDYHGEVEKFAELSWFHRIAKQSKLAEQWNDAHLVGKLKRADEHLLVIRSLTRSARAGRRQARVEKRNLGSVKAVWSRLWELKASTVFDTSVARQKYITNQALDEHRRTPLCTRCAWDTRTHCRTRFEIIWTNESVEGETASHVADNILSSSDVRN